MRVKHKRKKGISVSNILGLGINVFCRQKNRGGRYILTILKRDAIF